MAEKQPWKDLKQFEAYEAAKKDGKGAQFLKDHPVFAKNLTDSGYKGSDAPAPTTPTEKKPEDLKNWNAYQAAVAKGNGAKFLAKNPGFAKNLEKLGYKEPSDSDKATAKTKEILKAGTEYGDELADKYIPKGTFGQINSGTTPAMQAALDKLKADASTAGNLTPDEKAGLATLKDTTSTPAAISEALDNLKKFRDEAGNLTDLENEALDTMRSGLAGYEGPEVQAMREQAMRSIGRQYSGQLKALDVKQARQGIQGGGASFAQQQDLRGMQRGDVAAMETDLVARQADEVQNRRQAFAQLASATEAARTGRQVSTQDLYNRAQGQEHARLTTAATNYADLANRTANTAASRGLQANQLYTGALSGEESARTGREIFNAGQVSNEAIARGGLALGGIGAFTGMQSGQQAADTATQQANWFKDYQIKMKKQAEDLAKQNMALQERLANIAYSNIG